VIVDDADGATVPGSVITPPVDVSLPNLIFWRPDEGFQEGHSYHIDSAQDLVFWAVAAMTIDPGTLEPTSDCALEDRNFGEDLCCPRICDTEPCISAAVRRVPACHINWWADQDAMGAQYLGRVTWSTAEEPETTDAWQWGGYAAHDFSAQAAQYCYELEVVSLIDGSSKVLPESCVPHGSLGQVGVFAKSLTGFTNEVTNHCGHSPPELADTWCAGVASACTEGDPSACATQSSECAGGAAGQGGQGTAGEVDATAGQAAGGQSSGGQLTAGQDQFAAQAASADGSEALDLAQDSGCSCSVPGAAGTRLGVPAIALMALARICTRRRRRGPHRR
jgi:MYXO-CTERM domain-containing protein